MLMMVCIGCQVLPLSKLRRSTLSLSWPQSWLVPMRRSAKASTTPLFATTIDGMRYQACGSSGKST